MCAYRPQVNYAAVLVEHSVFQECFAGRKGGAFYQDVGNVTVSNSSFCNNKVGNDNEQDGEMPQAKGNNVWRLGRLVGWLV